jgi:outer membrane immunogenic protein
MRTRLWGTVSVLATIAASAGVAHAADLGTRAPAYKAPAPIVVIPDWAGFYIGVAGGYGFGSTGFNNLPTTINNAKPKGGVYGGFVGYNWQFGNVVTGIEGDFSGANLTASSFNFSRQKIDELASVRARLGYVLLPNLLVYGTGGGGWDHLTVTTNANNMTIPGVSSSISPFGWVAGGGLEYKVWGPVIARGEYLHYGFGGKGLNNFANANAQPNVSQSVDLVRGGVSYKF